MNKTKIRVALALLELALKAVYTLSTYVETILDLLDDGEVNNSAESPIPEMILNLQKALLAIRHTFESPSQE